MLWLEQVGFLARVVRVLISVFDIGMHTKTFRAFLLAWRAYLNVSS